MSHLPVLIVVIPLAAALVAPLAALRAAFLARGVVVTALSATVVSSVLALTRVLAQGSWHYRLGGWAPPWGIEYVVDALSGGMATLITVMALLVACYAGPVVEKWPRGREGVFSSLYLLLVTGLLGITVTGDMFNLYVFFEISSLAAYALMASGGIRATVATFRYLIIGTIAATFYLLGTGYLYAFSGTLNMADLTSRLSGMVGTPVYVVAVTFIVVGLAIKTALFPLHGWLPDAYTYAPAPVTGLISAVMAKVSAYALFRVLFFVLRTEGAAGQTLTVLAWASAIAVVAGSMMALAQQDVRRMLAFSSVGQMGYITLGLALGSRVALIGALLHVLNHAVMKGCLFLIAGGVRWHTGISRIEAFHGMGRRLPWTMAAFTVAALSMIGVPPTAGFFSKWYLLTGALEAHTWYFAAALMLSSLLSAVYFFRVLEVAYLRPAPESGDDASDGEPARRELPTRMLAPILILATAVLLLGVLNRTVVTRVIRYALPPHVL
jgi:multicomponent Na+:H+ antiporter subunit D